MTSVYCLECERKINLQGKLRIGNAVECPHCEAEYVLSSVEPVELDWPYGVEDDGDGEEGENDDEMDGPSDDWDEEWRHLIIKQRETRARNRNSQSRRLVDSSFDD